MEFEKLSPIEQYIFLGIREKVGNTTAQTTQELVVHIDNTIEKAKKDLELFTALMTDNKKTIEAIEKAKKRFLI
jgi:hypothetical protein